jgi:membrane protein DedA with SNARE-associated domain
MEELVATYGYPAIMAGTFLEGETVVIVAGYLASRHYLALGWVMICAFVGTWIGDSVYFFIGRRWGTKLLEKHPKWRPGAERALRLLRRHHTVFILCFRFIYGIRTVSPFAIGMSGVAPMRFILLNMCASAIWAAIFASGGFMLGSVLERMLGHIEHYETYFIATVVGVVMLISATHLVIARRMAKARHNGAGRKGDGS